MNTMADEKEIRKHSENLDRQLFPEALPYPRPGHGGVECPHCWQQIFPIGNKGSIQTCPFCEIDFRLGRIS